MKISYEIVLDNLIPLLGGLFCVFYSIFCIKKQKHVKKSIKRYVIILICGVVMLLMMLISVRSET